MKTSRPFPLLATLTFALATSSAFADPTACTCYGETFREGIVIKHESASPLEDGFYGSRYQIREFLCGPAGAKYRCADRGETPSANLDGCFAKILYLGQYEVDLRGSKAKFYPEKWHTPLVKERFEQFERRNEIETINTCQQDGHQTYGGKYDIRYLFRIDATFESARAGEASRVAPVAARPRPEDAASGSVEAVSSTPAAAQIAVDATTGEPIVDPSEALNTELNRQLSAQGWTSAALTQGYRSGRIVSARKALKLPLAKGKGTVSVEAGQIGEVVTTGYIGALASASPQVYVLWRKKKSNLIPILKSIAYLFAATQFSPLATALSLSGMLGGWQSYGEIKLVMAPADAADLLILK